MYGQWEASIMNSMMFKTKTALKKEGNIFEFQEFLAIVWLDYLLKIGYHDNTYSNSNLAMRLKQFGSLVKYDKMMNVTNTT